jgi:hypothetical protein
MQCTVMFDSNEARGGGSLLAQRKCMQREVMLHDTQNLAYDRWMC